MKTLKQLFAYFLVIPLRHLNGLFRSVSSRYRANRIAREYVDAQVRRAGDHQWICRDVPSISARQARAANREFIVGLLQDTGIPFFVIPTESGRQITVALEDTYWPQLLSALRSQPPVPEIGVVGKTLAIDSNLSNQALPLRSKRVESLFADALVIEIFQSFCDSTSKRIFGRNYGTIIERWSEDDEGTLQTDSQNPRANVIALGEESTQKISVGTHRVDTYAPLTIPSIFDTRRSIDVVYMWVNDDDPVWREKRDRIVSSEGKPHAPEATDTSRFRDNGELRYSLRSVHQHLDDVRKIFLVTDNQTPAWLRADQTEIELVDHTILFGESGKLPTFNSHAIAGRLHHITDLSENYIIMNDDIFIGRDIDSGKFFTANGQSKFFLSRSTLPLTNEPDSPHFGARENVRELLHRDFGVTVGRNFFHTPVPQLRSLLFELEDRYPDVFKKNWRSQLRSGADFEINGWLHHYYGFLTRRSTSGRISYDYFDTSDPQLISRLNSALAERRLDTFCINDNPNAPEENLNFIRKWLESYFPVPAPWETFA